MSRIALVTGGTRGIGAAVAKALVAAGNTVVASYHQNEEAAAEFSQTTGIKTYKWDVSDYDSSCSMITKIQQEVGPIDILVNNAGITRDTTFRKMSPQQWHDVISTNLGSCFNMSRCLIESMIAREFGRIVNISSVNAQRGQIGQVNYCAAKAGIIGFTKALAQETIRKGVTVNVVAPGYTDTDMVQAIPKEVLEKIVEKIPIGYLCEPEDIARGVVFLASDDAHYITGSTLSINGGLYYA